MRCHVCNVAVGDGQRFCHECGESLDGVTNPTEPYDVVPPSLNERRDPDERADLADPSTGVGNDAGWWAASGGAPEPDDGLPGTEPIDVVASSAVDGLASTEAIGVTPVPGEATRSSLDAVPYEPMDQVPSLDATPEFERTTAMAPASAAGYLDTTDELPPGGAAGVGSTAQMAVTDAGGLFDGGADVQDYEPVPEGFRLRAAFVFGVLAMIATLMASVADIIDIRTTRPVDGIIVGIRALDDFGSNLAVAGFIGAALMLVGGLLSCFGLRWGAGIAGGAGLSLTGWAAVTLGLVEAPIHAAEGVTLNAGEVTPFTLSVTRDLGYFLILSIGIIGLLVFLMTLRMAGTGGRRGLNPWIAAVGALAAVVLAAGPLITLGGAPLDANLGTVGIPKEFFAGRLVQLGLIVVTGVIGFLSVRTYGLGLALGGLGVATWMWVTSLADLGDLPVSVAVGNLGTRETTPHAVTTVGVTASLALLLIAATVATVTRRRV